jgi:inner membrane protein
MGKTHSLLGAEMFLAIGLLQHLPQNHLYWGMGVASLFALVPDIDTTKSWIGRRLWLVSLPLSKTVRHRGLTHSLAALGVLSMVLLCIFFAYPEWIFLYEAAFVGYFSHILGDFLTREGVSLFWPSMKRYRLGNGLFATNSVGEQVFCVVIGIVFVGLFIFGGNKWKEIKLYSSCLPFFH